MKNTILLLGIILLLLSCTTDNSVIEPIEIPNSQLTNKEISEFKTFLVGHWQVELDNSYREFVITENDIFKLKHGLPYKIEIASKTEVKLTLTNDYKDDFIGYYFKIIRQENSSEILVYRYLDDKKDAFSKSSYVKVSS